MTKQKRTDSHTSLKFQEPNQERLLVKGLINNIEAIHEVDKIFPTLDVFCDEASREVMACMISLYNDGKEVRPISVMNEMRSRGKFNLLIDSQLSLSAEAMMPISTSEIISSAEAILSSYKRELVSGLNSDLFNKLRIDDNDESIAQLVENIYKTITLSAVARTQKTSMQAASIAAENMHKAINRYREGGLAGIPTGSRKLDKFIGGWKRDELVIIAGRPGMGKTVVGINSALSAAEAGRKVGFFSIEMPASSLMIRFAACHAGVKVSAIRNGSLTDEEAKRVENSMAHVGNLPILFYDENSVRDTKTICSVAREWKRKDGVEILFIDYLQYLEASSRSQGSTEKITMVSKDIKSLQVELEIPIIAMAQLNRGTEQRSDPRPQLSDIKESGQIEQDASIVIGLFNPAYYEDRGMTVVDETKAPYDKNSFIYYILKNRDGASNVRVDRYADLSISRIEDFDFIPSMQTPSFPADKANPFFKPSIDYSANRSLDEVESSFFSDESPEPPF